MPEAKRDSARFAPPIVRGSGGSGGKGGGGGGSATEDPNTLQSDSLINIIDLISEGEIDGLIDGAQSILFNDTQLVDDSGNVNFAGVSWDVRTGLPDQDYIAGFSDSETPVTVNTQIFAETPVIRTYNGPIDAVRVIISIPQLTYMDPNSGDLHGSSVSFAIMMRPSGTSTWAAVGGSPFTISGKNVSPYEVAYRVNLGGAGDWDVMVKRLTGDSTSVNLNNQTWWASTDIITDGKFSYPNSAYIGLAADAQYFGSSIPTRAYWVRGIKVQVPSNYDPVTRSYTGLWDGTFQIAWTNNPAWVLYDLLTNDRYGLGAYIDTAQVDKWSLYSIAQYCDALVPDGFGGTEPRYTFNYQITSRDDAYKLVQLVASCFRGMTFWGSGLVYTVADMPADPVKLVTPANVKDGLLTYEGTALSARHSVVEVTWFNPDDNCRPAIELVEDAALIAQYGWRPLALTAYGCTSRGQARRMGNWALDTEKYATETVNYQAAWDHADITPGDIIEIYDPDYAGARMGGRILSATATSVTPDNPVTLQSGQSYTLKIVMPDGMLASCTVTNGVGAASVLTFATPLTTLPVTGAMFGLTATSLAPRQFRVMSVKEGADGWFTVSALFHDPTKYDRIEQGFQLDTAPTTLFAYGRPDAPINMTVQEYIYDYGTGMAAAASVGWSAPANAEGIQSYQIQRARANGNWETVGTTNATCYDVKNSEAGNWSFRIRAVSYNGLPSDWLTKDVVLFGLTLPPADVQNFTLGILGANATLSWSANTDVDIDHYRIKFAPVTTGATWAAATDLIPQATGTSSQTAAMAGTYLIKAVSTFGIESINATLIETTISAVQGLNEVAVVSDWPIWGGSNAGTAIAGGAVQLASADTIADWSNLASIGNLAYGTEGLLEGGIYTFANGYDLGAVYTSRLSSIIDAVSANILDAMSTWADLASQANLSGANAADWSVTLQVRTTQTDPTASPVWSAWQNLVVGDYTARAFQFRLLLASDSPSITPIVSDVSINIDMPDRVLSESAVSVPSSGITISFTPAFRTAPAVGITGQNLQTGDFFQYTSTPSPSGFSGQWINAAGMPIARVMDVMAKGIGYAA